MNKSRIQAFARAVSSLRDVITDEQAVTMVALYPNWKINYSYTIGTRILYKNNLYRIIQDHVSQSDWTPEVATSLYAKILTSDNGAVLPWKQPDSTNGYMVGDKVLYNNKTWESLINNNVWEPNSIGTEGLWKEIT